MTQGNMHIDQNYVHVIATNNTCMTHVLNIESFFKAFQDIF